ncbi:hypothetical protein ACFY9Q_23080 [Streptomyces sp. NPDC012389]|uniref:hypothetical protein n=1 Tax=unclassified Streptomyces TaxID=2593676 RepID=UPI00081D442B|nr:MULTISPECIES: hypothetical protein [unclassified Streptomyces]MYR95921.1 hypothetical protein [Streptomyces sp. SID4937]SCD99726.1 hypothetical protein GA0115243_105664 [Streptomyces sp. ScaeMP-e83]
MTHPYLTDVQGSATQSRGNMKTWIHSHSIAVGTGVVVGAAGPLLLTTGGKAGDVAHLTLSAGWSWAALAFLIGMLGKTKLQSASAGTTALICAVLAYYLTKASQGEYVSADLNDTTGQTTYFDWGGFLLKLFLWFFFGFLLGPLLGIAAHLSLRSRFRHVLQLPVPLVALVETSMRLQNEAGMQGDIATATWTVTRVAAMIGIAILVVLSVFGIWRRRRSPEFSSGNGHGIAS